MLAIGAFYLFFLSISPSASAYSQCVQDSYPFPGGICRDGYQPRRDSDQRLYCVRFCDFQYRPEYQPTTFEENQATCEEHFEGIATCTASGGQRFEVEILRDVRGQIVVKKNQVRILSSDACLFLGPTNKFFDKSIAPGPRAPRAFGLKFSFKSGGCQN